ncbi:hypothetical protein [Metamycoplasma equirhinis]|uniref:hypothetical protein n=1 Tax=Metamycoplasma equirhinis TaxID=92402 RepID=UPI00359C3EBB
MNETSQTILLKEKRIKKQKNYFFTRDYVTLWTIILLVTIFFATISFINVRGITTIHAYTTNILFGLFSILFYGFVFTLSLFKLFKLESGFSVGIFHFHLIKLALWYIAWIILGSMIFYTISLHGTSFNSKNSFSVIYKNWFDHFSSNGIQNKNYLLPNLNTPGIIGTFFFGIFSFIGGKAGLAIGFIISIIIFALISSLFFVKNKAFLKLAFWKKQFSNPKIENSTNKSNNVMFEQTSFKKPNKTANLSGQIINKINELNSKKTSINNESIYAKPLVNDLDDFNELTINKTQNISVINKEEKLENIKNIEIDTNPFGDTGSFDLKQPLENNNTQKIEANDESFDPFGENEFEENSKKEDKNSKFSIAENENDFF